MKVDKHLEYYASLEVKFHFQVKLKFCASDNAKNSNNNFSKSSKVGSNVYKELDKFSDCHLIGYSRISKKKTLHLVFPRVDPTFLLSILQR